MASLTKAVRSLLGNRRSERSILKLSLKLYMTVSYSCDIGKLLNDAINDMIVNELDLAIIDDNEPEHWRHKYMREQARKVDRQLQHLSINNCDAGDRSVWQTNAPDSQLRVLEISHNLFLRVEVLCLPKLERLFWNGWRYEAPLLLGSVPALEELCLIHALPHDFSLSEVFRGTPNLHTLTLNFQGERLWIQPEGKQLCSAFNKLRKLSINGIYVEFDLLWTINLLEAAPTVEIFDVEMFEHPCVEAMDGVILYHPAQKVKPSWEIPKFKSYNKWQLKELQFVGFRPGLDHHFSFISAVMDRALNLKTVLLIDDQLPCAQCDAMAVLPPPIGGTFPRDKDERLTIVKQLKDMACSSAQIERTITSQQPALIHGLALTPRLTIYTESEPAGQCWSTGLSISADTR
ncbi:uncharacterized protein LOC112272423 [Brachypodium distachyon]|uniref:uncharacterized protein LOC112272423 n=1 Tax=Brachypodium distachyon TaxID=15368 RepID=UPI000D0DF944|nr:uncharacterized protein LOC112272423 [Brachypodium distachyon]|eukprot:XP_024318914.1 uncharacterized protein LOC112272423 [Brachypodium distachyon]